MVKLVVPPWATCTVVGLILPLGPAVAVTV